MSDRLLPRLPLRIEMLFLLLGVAAGCSTSAAEPAASPPPVVIVSRPIVRDVADYVDFTGRTQAQFSVDIRARVTGYLMQMPFVEGAEVKTGALLFEIDPRPFQAQVDKAKADVALNEAKLKVSVRDQGQQILFGSRLNAAGRQSWRIRPAQTPSRASRSTAVATTIRPPGSTNRPGRLRRRFVKTAGMPTANSESACSMSERLTT
jgi:multidrug efflux pump subunit AcrA (membrane-fusion protein)